MNIQKLIDTVGKKELYYIDGRIEPTSNNLFLSFSSGYNGRGNSLDLRIGSKDYDIDVWVQNTAPTTPFNYSKKNISEKEVWDNIEKYFKDK